MNVSNIIRHYANPANPPLAPSEGHFHNMPRRDGTFLSNFLVLCKDGFVRVKSEHHRLELVRIIQRKANP